MFIDAQTQLSSAQAVTVDAVSTNAYDLGAAFSGGSANGAAIDPSVGEPMGIVVVVTVAAKVSATDETYAFEAIQSTVTALTAPDVLTRVQFTNALAATNLTAGAVIVIPLSPGLITKRFIGLNYDTGGTGPTITCTSWIAPLSMIQKQKFYTSAIVVN
jgi:hypothetical protein